MYSKENTQHYKDYNKWCLPDKYIFKYLFFSLENKEREKIKIQKKVKYLMIKNSASNKRAVFLKQFSYSSG